MRFKPVSDVMLSLFAFVLLFGCVGGVRLAVPAYAAELPTGKWLEVACDEGYVGPDAPPPPYSKGIIRISGQTLFLSSRIYDDSGCTTLRPGVITETQAPFTIAPGVTTTDGSIAIDAVMTDPDDGSTSTLYGLIRVQDGKLGVAFYASAAARPTALNPDQAQIFAPF